MEIRIGEGNLENPGISGGFWRQYPKNASVLQPESGIFSGEKINLPLNCH
jgi:hypothetical protein